MEEIRQQLSDIQTRLTNLEQQLHTHVHTGLDSQQLPGIPSGLSSAPLAAITPASGGATQDLVLRSVVALIISDLQSLGLTL